MAHCPNKALPEWQSLVISRGEIIAHYLWDKYEGEVPESQSKSSIVNSGLKAIDILNSEKAKQTFSVLTKNKVTGETFWKKLQQDLGIPKEQVELLKSSNTYNREELLTSLLADYSYVVEVNTALSKETRNDQQRDLDTGETFGSVEYEGQPTQHYSNLTVPGGTNYTENEIKTLAITPAIKGHAQFSTENGIGWFRSDEQHADTEDARIKAEAQRISMGYATSPEGSKTRRILEIQSDIFQKGRDIKSAEDIYAEMKKSGELIVDCG